MRPSTVLVVAALMAFLVKATYNEEDDTAPATHLTQEGSGAKYTAEFFQRSPEETYLGHEQLGGGFHERIHSVAESGGRRSFTTQATGLGNSFWNGTEFPYFFDMADPQNEANGRIGLARAQARFKAAGLCVNWYEVKSTEGLGNRYVTVRDSNENACTGGGRGINLNNCGVGSGLHAHEMMHVMGIGHEHQRADQPENFRWKPENIQSGQEGSIKANNRAVFNAYDYNSLQFYGTTSFNNRQGDRQVFSIPRSGMSLGCSPGLSKGDIDNINFATQYCWQEPMKPLCRTSVNGSITIGTANNKNITFVATYKKEKMTATFTNLPGGGSVYNWRTRSHQKQALYTVAIEPTADDIGKEFNITALFTSESGLTAECAALVRIHPAPYICDGIPSTFAATCSGHGNCARNTYPQCDCAPGYGGAYCEGIDQSRIPAEVGPTCPSNVFHDYGDTEDELCHGGSVNLTSANTPSGRAVYRDAVRWSLIGGWLRQPSEISYLVKLDSTERYRFRISNGFTDYRTFANGMIGPVNATKEWVLMRYIFDWRNDKMSIYANGQFVSNNGIASCDTTLTTTDGNKCTVSSVDIAGLKNTSNLWADRFRLYCSADHMSIFSSEALSVGPAFAGIDQYIWLKAPLSTYHWNPATASGLCVSTYNGGALLTGAAYDIPDSTKPYEMRLTIPAATAAAAAPAGLDYIKCTPTASHFSAPVAAVVDTEPYVLAFAGSCAHNRSTTYPTGRPARVIGNLNGVAARTQNFSTSFGINTNSDFVLRITTRSSEAPTRDLHRMYITASGRNSGEVKVSSNGNTQTAAMTAMSTAKQGTIQVGFDWPAASNLMATVHVKFSTDADATTQSFSQEMNATWVRSFSFYYIRGNASDLITLDATCPTPTAATSGAAVSQYGGEQVVSARAPASFTAPTSTPIPDTLRSPLIGGGWASTSGAAPTSSLMLAIVAALLLVLVA